MGAIKYADVSPYVLPGMVKGTVIKFRPVTHGYKLSKILNLVAKETGVDIEKISGRCRERQFVKARQIFCYLCRTCTSETLIDIAKVLKRDHTTVIASVARHRMLMETEKELQQLTRRTELKI